MRKTLATAILAAGLLAGGTGVANADTPPDSTTAHYCLNHPDDGPCYTPAPPRPNFYDVNPRTISNGGEPPFGERLRSTVARFIADVWNGPQW